MNKNLNFEEVEKPWGKYKRFTLNRYSTVKLLTLEPYQKLSYQKHKKRDEFWRVLPGGNLYITIGSETFDASEGDEFYIPSGKLHRIQAKTKKAYVLEIAFGKFEETDIERTEDDYGRVEAKAKPEELKVSKDMEKIVSKALQEVVEKYKSRYVYIGALADEQRTYLVERDLKTENVYLVPSFDGENFLQPKKFPIGNKKNTYYYIPVETKDWNNPLRDKLKPRRTKFDHANLTILNEFKSPEGKIVLYDTSYITSGHQRLIGGAALISEDNELLWRSEDPLWDVFLQEKDQKYMPLGAVLYKGHYYIYYSKNEKIFVVKVNDPYKTEETLIETAAKEVLKRHHQNPILSPHPDNHWENFAVFNPAAVVIDDKIHMFYRAQGHGHMSVVGYAESTDGYNFTRYNEPVYIPDDRFLKVIKGQKKLNKKGVSGEGWGGCEDPRVTVIGDRMYLIYVAFDGWSEPRLAMSSIALTDIAKKNWDGWSDPMFLTPHSTVWGTGNKSGLLFPEKINGKYVIMHRYWPNICIDFVDDLNFGEGIKFLQTKAEIKVRKDHWDSNKIGAGAPPIMTDEGWLLVYFGVGYQEGNKYKIGAMILDKDNPANVLARSSEPLINPQTWYENECVIPGAKAGVAYPCGAVVKDGEFIMYYGGADVVVCAASCELAELLYDLKKDIVDTNLLKPVNVHS